MNNPQHSAAPCSRLMVMQRLTYSLPSSSLGKQCVQEAYTMLQQGLQDQGGCWAWAAGHVEPFAASEASQSLSPALARLATSPSPSEEEADPVLAMLHQQAGPFLAGSRQPAAGPHPSAAGGFSWPDSPEAACSLPEQLDTSAASSTLLRAYAGSWLGLKLPAGDAGQSLCRAAQLQTLQGGAAECTDSKLPLHLDACLLQLPDNQVPLPVVSTEVLPKRPDARPALGCW